MNGFALMQYDANGCGSEVVSTHKTEAAADRAFEKLGNVRGYYVAHRKANGEFETVREADDRRNFGRKL